MRKKSKFKLFVGCAKHKLSFKKEEIAWEKAIELYFKLSFNLYPFYCEYCNLYHLTSRVKIKPDWVKEKLLCRVSL